ncbi:MAG: rRNA maturation RNase YbeY [Gammaproteobacteria bacterium]|nr:rRNA maturation RNase YbeY [Gammaproteobacteria bacterium]MDH5799737.1 rRNA maturation RNase YbeY [Gammaproteobacteria bacterium]
MNTNQKTEEPPQPLPCVELDFQVASTEYASIGPDQKTLERWIVAAAAAVPEKKSNDHIQLTVRVVDESEMTQLNQTYRNKTGSTNVLSFPAELPEDLPLPLLGDVLVCAPVVRREALEQHKSLEQHWAHMIVHGVLHLMGYDHISDEEAETMEALEVAILAKLDFPNPYTESEAS